MKFTMGAGGIPAGAYRLRFAAADDYNDNADKYGAGVLLKWEVLEGEHEGEETTRICSAKLSPKSNLAKFAVALKGGPVASGEEVNFGDFIGATGTGIVEETESGSTRVSTFLRDKEE